VGRSLWRLAASPLRGGSAVGGGSYWIVRRSRRCSRSSFVLEIELEIELFGAFFSPDRGGKLEQLVSKQLASCLEKILV